MLKYKLSEEMIARRPKQKYSEPNEPSDLKVIILAQDPHYKRDCDICDSELYSSLKNCLLPHAYIKLEKGLRPNQYGKACYLPPKLRIVGLKCENMHLVRQTIEYFDKDKTQLNDMQFAALDKLNAWITRRLPEIMGKQKNANFDKLMPEAEMRQLLTHLMNLFFIRDSSRIHFQWINKTLHHKEQVAGTCSRTGIMSHTIKIRTWFSAPENKSESNWIPDLIFILLYEAVHLQLQLRGCEKCFMANWTDHRCSGHGRAWQVLAAKVE